MDITTVKNTANQVELSRKGISPIVDNFFNEGELQTQNINNTQRVLNVLRIVNASTDKVSITLTRDTVQKDVKIENTFDLHDYIINNVPVKEVKVSDIEDSGMDFPYTVAISSASNKIAQATYRGPGNVVVVSKNNEDKIKPFLNSVSKKPGFNYTYTYRYIGELNGISYYIDETGLLSDEYVIVCYNATDLLIDSGIAAVVDSDKNVWLQFQENWKDYFSVLKLV